MAGRRAVSERRGGGEKVGIRFKATNPKIYLKNPSILNPDCLRKSLKIKPWLLALPELEQTWATTCHSLYFQAHHPGRAGDNSIPESWIRELLSRRLIRPVMSLLMDGLYWSLCWAGARRDWKQDPWLSVTISGRTLWASENPSGSSVPWQKWNEIFLFNFFFFSDQPSSFRRLIALLLSRTARLTALIFVLLPLSTSSSPL